ncbi:MAG: DUF3078 domain-containing protein [Flavobacteriaceae bacterium]|jgi:hypothetical protein|uniref:DUF3078 domain-containing protein n=1 Tax=Flavobacterium kayseriense TaxID=2764714 RepID=A0ABR7J3Q8_9FLAO|nr:DUF3078 domain-containing protein [Flavobacterium kayseriense]MBC5840191.1 DUF3078 domain-containing protein [Flavobacterium kayseriense]MBC5847139.1 DUF3078 domain-containing protein [Flavobacterium kayseriense]MBX9888002.1 DUF3078 domain-containing protein [Flavobacteriaceae bacterium]
MKFTTLNSLFILLLFTSNIFSQKIITTLEGSLKKPKDTVSHWTKKNQVGFDISEIAFVNWNAGGTSSVSGLLKTKFNRNYNTDNYNWSNELIMRYGLNKQDGIELRKSDDVFQFSSAFGYRKDTLSNWYHTAKFNFNTQFTNGYAYPNTEKSISKPFAPAYVFLGLGAEYASQKKDELLYLSPFTSKMTFVLDQSLANQGAFGVVKGIYDSNGILIIEGEKSKIELGFLLTGYYKKQIIKNVIVENRLSLYSDYINNFGNIDVDYNVAFDLVVNEYIRTSIGIHVIYDDDIKAKKNIDGEQVTLGPKTQLKQMLGVGLLYQF